MAAAVVVAVEKKVLERIAIKDLLALTAQSELYGRAALEHSHQLALDHLNFGVMNEFVY